MRRTGDEIASGEVAELVGDEVQHRADDRGVVAEQEPADARQYGEVPVGGRGRGSVQTLENAYVVRVHFLLGHLHLPRSAPIHTMSTSRVFKPMGGRGVLPTLARMCR